MPDSTTNTAPSPLNRAAPLLLITGVLLGLTFPLGKLSGQAQIPPAVWAFLVAAGASSILLMIHTLQGRKVNISKEYLQFYCISASVSLVIPNLLIFTVIPKLGAGFTGLMFTLSPIFTLALQSLTRLKLPSALGLAGISIGFIGAIIVASTRGEVGQPASIIWLLAGLGIPASLAIGNVYRTLAWPTDASPTELAIGSNLAAASFLLIVVALQTGFASLQTLIFNPVLSLTQMIVAALMFHFYFRLQLVGGPIYLSQISYVGAAVALGTGTLLFGERYSQITWLGACVIIVGIIGSVVAQRRST